MLPPERPFLSLTPAFANACGPGSALHLYIAVLFRDMWAWISTAHLQRNGVQLTEQTERSGTRVEVGDCMRPSSTAATAAVYLRSVSGNSLRCSRHSQIARLVFWASVWTRQAVCVSRPHSWCKPALRPNAEGICACTRSVTSSYGLLNLT